MKRKNVFKLVIAIFICQLAGAIGSIFTVSAIAGWYSGLAKPALNPPNWLLTPYILWVSFAAYLNYSIWLLN